MSSHFLWVVAALAITSAVHAQTPRVWLKFDGDLTDASGAGVVTAVTPSAGFTPTYVADRFGVAGKAIQFPTAGAASLQLIAASLANDSNQALGLRTAASANTSFTMMAWVYVNSVSSQGYNTVFGNLGTGTGTLHAGLNTNSDKAHFGFDGNDVTGAAASLVAGQWYHLAFVYDVAATTGQRIYVNGIPDVTRTGVTDTLKAADLIIGNWGTATDASNDFRGRLDDVTVYNTALKGDQILAIVNGGSVATPPAVGTYFAPATTYGYRGTTGMWGVREIKNYSGISYASLVNADRILKAYATTPGGTVANYWTSVLNITDDENPGNLGYFDSEGDFATNTPADDNNILLFARCTVKIPTAGSYTFGFRSDDGSRLRIVGKPFVSSTRVNGSNNADPANIGDTLYYPNATGDSATLGVVTLPVGEVDLEYTYWEGSGGCALEVFAAPGAKTSVDSAFQLIGNTAAGGLEIIRDSDTVPTFTANGGTSLFVQSGSPSTFTLAWSVADAGTTLSINQGIGAAAQTGSLVLASPAATTTYTITATTGADVVTRSVIVYVNAKPNATISANDTTVIANAAVTLTWATEGATTLVLNPGNITVTGQTTRVVNPAATTTYILTATNAAGSIDASVTVTVGTAPVINSFTTSDASPIYGKDTNLNWVTTNADTASLNQNIGAVATTGSISVVPLIATTYTLTATNTYGATTANVIINMPTPIGVSSAGFTARRVSATTPFPFTGQGYLQSALSVLGGQNAGTTTTTSNYTTINFADGADGDFTSGNVAFPGGSGDNFAVEITGTLVINVPGEYNIIVNCDDGCRLRIDGVDVIVDDANHTPTASSGRYTFTKTTAQVQLVYYDATGGASCEMAWIRPNLVWQQIGVATPATPIVRGSLLINEFMASGSTLADEDGATQDWIEVWNSTSSAVNLAGCYLTAISGTPNQWAFPSKVLAPNEYLVVYASGKNRVNPAANLHTNFTLPGSGGYLALMKDNGAGGYTTLTAFNPYPAQTSGQSYGSSDSEGYVGFIETPTPGALNAATYTGFIQPVTFSTPRGRYSSAFSLTLASTTPGAEIRYTLDGSAPTQNHGLVYAAPLNISVTTTLRAAAFLSGWKPTAIETHSYLFTDDIVSQTAAYATGKGWPSAAVNGQVYTYGMKLAAVTAAGGDVNDLKTALAAAPSMCLNMSQDDFSGATNGIYSNPGKRGRFWERDASLEIINPDGSSAIQKDCGVRIRGNASRATTNAKHAFHLYFRSLYGGDLIYPLFGSEGAVTRFDQIDMRCEENNSWSKDNSSLNALMREEFARKTQGDMGQPYSRNAFFHLYINGIYWGIFNWEEKTEADYAANQFGGTDADYDTVKSAASSNGYNTEMTDGNFIAWQQLFNAALALKNAATETARTAKYLEIQGRNANGTTNAAYPVLLDVDNLIDYELMMFYAGSFDAPMSTFLNNASNNWFGIRNRVGTRGFMFFAHDFEHGMGTGTQSYNRVGPWGDPNATSNNWGQTWTTAQYRTRETFTKFNPHYLHEFLCFSAEYRQRFMDRVQKHFYNGGALTQAAAVARADALAAKIDPIIHGEAARWGSATLNKNTWLNTGKAGVYTFINSGGTSVAGQTIWTAQPRGSLIVEQLKGYTDGVAMPLASSLTPPTFSGQQGGNVNGPYSFQISNPNGSGSVYYTLDGTDPRAIGGTVSGTALTAASPINVTLVNATTVRARIYVQTTQEWSPLVEASYIVSASPGSATNLVVSKIHYNPAANSAEYLEVLNISSGTVELTNCRFTLGITYTFPTGYLLAAGARCVIVESSTTFNAVFPGQTALVAGQYSGNLSNGGERLTFVDKNSVNIKDFTYDDEAGWPTPPDGNGPALVLKRPETNPDHNNAANWRSSTTNGGAPGTADSYGYALWNTNTSAGDLTGTLDGDGDGLLDLIEYALGLNPAAINTSNGLVTGTTTVASQPYMTLTCVRPMGRDDIVYTVETSTTLTGTWPAAVLVSSTPNYTTGMVTEIYRCPNPKTSTTPQFMRARVTWVVP